MPRSLRIEYPGAVYHVMCRGNKGSTIFIDDADRVEFLRLLAESLEIYSVILHAYVMMHNHYHLVIQTLRANLSEFMRRFNICFTGWFNYHHGTIGHLYQGRYKSLLVDADTYLLELSRYVHLNPGRSEIPKLGDRRTSWRKLQEYEWSSLPGYLRRDRIKTYVRYDMILHMIGGRRQYQRFMTDGLERALPSPTVHAKYQTILGSERFVKSIKKRLSEKRADREQPIFRQMRRQTVDPEVIIKHVCERLGVSRAELIDRYSRSMARGMASEMLYRYGGLNLGQIGNLLGVHYSSIHRMRCRLQQRISKQEDIARVYEDLETIIRSEISNVKI
jgi:REP element-mobilizing transposase RayT